MWPHLHSSVGLVAWLQKFPPSLGDSQRRTYFAATRAQRRQCNDACRVEIDFLSCTHTHTHTVFRTVKKKTEKQDHTDRAQQQSSLPEEKHYVSFYSKHYHLHRLSLHRLHRTAPLDHRCISSTMGYSSETPWVLDVPVRSSVVRGPSWMLNGWDITRKNAV